MSILLEQLTKRYESHPVVNNVSLEVGDGEFFVLLGSSGSGKTTILGLIAGLTRPDHGRIFLHGREVTHLPPQQRRVGLVFQNYALFEHMSVADNVEFGLSIRKVPPVERRRKRDELLDLVGLAGLGNRLPRQLSGGQQQRVALARALAVEPDVLLLDEPLGALDAKIRVDLRRTLRVIQRQLGIATILVTHDQEEAFDLADRIGVMSFGRLLEVGTPQDLYQKPQTEFVATFLGSANLLVGEALPDGIQVGHLHFPIGSDPVLKGKERRLQVLFRPEDVAVSTKADELDCPTLGKGEVEDVSFAGQFEHLRLRLPPINGVRAISPPVGYGGNSILVDASRLPDQTARIPLKPGDTAWVGVRRIHALAHPGMSFMIVTDGSLRAQAALDLGGHIARLAHARVTLLGYGRPGTALDTHLREARKQLGSGLASLDVININHECVESIIQASDIQPYDLVVMGFNPQEELPLIEEIERRANLNLLLVPGPGPVPARALICVATGEPGKEDVLFTGRLMRHLGGDATLLSVLPATIRDSSLNTRAGHFLEGGVKTLSVLGVPARPLIRNGLIQPEISDELKKGEYDLLVLGAPLSRYGSAISLKGVVGSMLSSITDIPALIVRSNYVASRRFERLSREWKYRLEESRR